MKAEERAREVVYQLNAIIDMSEAMKVVARTILAAQRDAIDRCLEEIADTRRLTEPGDYARSIIDGAHGRIYALLSLYEEAQ